jgi:uncharacterized protein YacL
MNVNRLLWLTMTVLCGIAGGLIGWKLGNSYTDIRVTDNIGDGPMVQGPLRWVIIVTITLSSTIILARVGSWLADRALMSLAQVHRLSVADRVLGITGVLIGVMFGALVSLTLNVPEFGSWMVLIKICLLLVSMALGVALLVGMRSEMLRVFPALDEAKPVQSAGAAPKILDTNVIIDGRIADLCRSGFIEGTVFVPNFVLNELQYIADSADSLRRARGRRGLEALNAMRDITVARGDGQTNADGEPLQTPLVQVLNEIPASVLKIDTVDSKLVALAKEMSGAIVTNDFNLNRVAELQGIRVLNLNQLALSLKPVVLPGEELSLTIVREGKEAGQGVGYLEDGTMVVVGDGREHVGETCKVTITQVIQTVAGKMIFAEFRGGESAPAAPKGPKGAGDDLFDGGNGNHGNGGRNGDDFGSRSGGGMRRKGKS